MPRKKQNQDSGEEAVVGGVAEYADPPSPPPVSKSRKRVFRCQFCAKEFLRNEHLQRHERLHTKEKPFSCSTCSQTFTRRDLLARHVRISHAPLVDRCDSGSVPHGQEEPQPTERDLGPSIDVHSSTAHHEGSSWNASNQCYPNVTSSGPGLSLCPDPRVPANSTLSADNTGVFSPQLTGDVPHISWAQPSSNFGDFALFIDSMDLPCGNSAAFLLDQPTSALPSHPLFGDLNELQPDGQKNLSHMPLLSPAEDTSTPRLFDEFSSTFPSFEPPSKHNFEPWKVTQQDWEHLLSELQKMVSVLPANFLLPSRHTMTRYIATYFSGFHRHLPFLHLPTFKPTEHPVELILGMAIIGAQSAFDNANAVMFFRASYAITLERLRRRKAELCEMKYLTEDGSNIRPAPQQIPHLKPGQPIRDVPTNRPVGQHGSDQFDPLPIAQTLLLLMAVATWGNSKMIYDEAIGLQNILVKLMRDEKLLEPHIQPSEDMAWDEWIRVEGFKRTVAIVFCFLVFHTIVYDTPPAIQNSELNIRLPSLESSWAARSEKEWRETRRQYKPESSFQSCFTQLFSREGNAKNLSHHECSSLSAYILILALIQHIYLLREMARYRPPLDQGLASNDVADMEQALRNWQHRWYMDPESSFGPGNPHGPISFNSTALLRMAYIRLTVDVGPWRALNTHDPHDIAESIHRSPGLEPTRKLTRAVLYSAHALSIPVKIGVNIVARNQAFSWSLQHSLCALECAFVLSKWLIALQLRSSGVSMDEDETRLLAYIADMVAEADSGFSIDSHGDLTAKLPDLCIRVVQIWAKLLSGVAVWDVVRMIGKALAAYGEILEREWGKIMTERGIFNHTG
ncbi:unnamed protein product [Penicillium salamii]|uniref:C2H2-type domain-containing protein n=1 Tax=Penicillium salamii TaxID=1612424 RepID=A0A9W4J0H5_9EURO|nr:unnamed protein product [Penicillium salamii]CAG8224382.1 unnamed protein product [Penicillium salamii]CAG8290480.1 unnamed protein product [Penicillium salamii]CAG8318664.1 unnamed protein product [Penicillium salamii]CAG8331218.1 unnamed protein product [Penicillium salamii]